MNKEERKMKICDSCEHAINRGSWCEEFKCPIQIESEDITKCFGYEPKSFTNLFEAYEAEQKKRKEEERK